MLQTHQHSCLYVMQRFQWFSIQSGNTLHPHMGIPCLSLDFDLSVPVKITAYISCIWVQHSTVMSRWPNFMTCIRVRTHLKVLSHVLVPCSCVKYGTMYIFYFQYPTEDRVRPIYLENQKCNILRVNNTLHDANKVNWNWKLNFIEYSIIKHLILSPAGLWKMLITLKPFGIFW